MATFDVFLSHNSKNKAQVRELKTILEANELSIWYDEDRLRPGVPWQKLLQKGIESSTSVAVLIGSDGLGPWEDEEMQAALRMAVKAGPGRAVIPILLPGAPAEPELPMFLGNRTWVDLREGYTEAGVAKVLWGVTGTKPSIVCGLPDGRSSALSSRAILAPSRLRHGATHLFGREKELALLDEAWANPRTRILTFVAWGGVGKTSLVVEWMNRQAAAGWPGFERVFDWSFYSQGTSDQSTASADKFVADALSFFGDKALADSNSGAWDKGVRLAQLVGAGKNLLVLDGLEPLQFPPGPMAGQLKEPALQSLLKGLARQGKSGLCVITTREPIEDLASFRDTTCPAANLENLSVQAGVELLRACGVKGTAKEFDDLVKEVDGHALTLSLLGTFLAKAHKGDIRKVQEVELEKADTTVKGGHAFKTMGAYECWLAGGGNDGERQRAVLQLMGLFDRPADAGCIAALRNKPVIKDLTQPLVGLSEVDWNLTISALKDCKLLSEHPNGALDAHPLVREYFAKHLREDHPKAWQSAHRRLYEHLTTTTKEGDQPSFEGLQPLYQAVAHGCAGGMQRNAFADVYYRRITRIDEMYTVRTLGAYGAGLGAIASFFDLKWSAPIKQFARHDQGWLLNEASIHLRALGRQEEAIEPMRAALDLTVELEDWRQASTAALNLGELELTLGNIGRSIDASMLSHGYAVMNRNDLQVLFSLAGAADGLHQSGRDTEALKHYEKAEELQSVLQPKHPLLYSLPGFRFCDLLLGPTERVAWRRELVRAALPAKGSEGDTLAAVERRGCEAIKWESDMAGAPLLDFAVHYLTLARVALLRALLGHAKLGSARNLVDEASSRLRKASSQDYVPLGFLARAWFRTATDDFVGAQADLDEAWEIASRGPMRLHMADIHLYRARLFFKVKPYPWESAAADLAAARKLIESCGYGRRLEELADAERVILAR